MAAYWWAVIARAAFDSWALVVGLNTWPQLLLALAPALITGALYLYKWGRDVMHQEYLRPILVALTAYVILVSGVFLINLARTPYLLQQEALARATTAEKNLQEAGDRAAAAEARGTQSPLANPDSGTDHPLMLDLARKEARIASLEGEVSTLRAMVAREPQRSRQMSRFEFLFGHAEPMPEGQDKYRLLWKLRLRAEQPIPGYSYRAVVFRRDLKGSPAVLTGSSANEIGPDSVRDIQVFGFEKTKPIAPSYTVLQMWLDSPRPQIWIHKWGGIVDGRVDTEPFADVNSKERQLLAGLLSSKGLLSPP